MAIQIVHSYFIPKLNIFLFVLSMRNLFRTNKNNRIVKVII